MATDLANLVIKVSQDGVSQAQSGLDGLTRSGANAEKSVGALTTATGGLVSALAKIAAAVGGVYAVQRAFQAGIRAVDDFRVSVIGIAATLTDMAKPGQGSMETVFARNKAAAEDMYKAITVEAAKHFSSASEGMMVYNRLVQSGYSVQKSEVSDLLLLTDKIKLATKGQNVEMQLNTEIIALMSGQAKAQSMIAMELQSRLGSGWGELVKKHREAGDLLKWISSLFPGLVTANKEIEGTLNAQWATTKSLLDLLSIGGLAGAYDDIVGFVKDINKYLKDHGQELAGNIMTAWTAVKEVAGGVVLVVSEIVGWIKSGWGYLEGWRSSLSAIANQRADMGVGMGLDVMPGLGEGGIGKKGFGYSGAAHVDEAVVAQIHRNNQALADAAAQYKKEAYKAYLSDMGPVKTAPRAAIDKGGGGGGGKGTDAAESAMKSFIETMKSETAKAAGDTEAILGAWYGKQLLSIEKWKTAGLDTTEALGAADAAYYSKLEKLNSDFSDWYNSGLGNQYEKLVAEEKKKLDTIAGNKAKEAQVIEVYDRKHFDLSQQMETERTNLFKGYLDTMAGLSPVLADQLGYKREALALELRLADAALERSRREGKITQDTYEQAQAMQAVVAQAKKFNLEMENDKGIRGWAYGRVKEADQRNTIKDMMGGLESGFQNAFSSGLQGVLQGGNKKTLKDIGKTMFEGLIGELHKGATTKLFDSAAKMFRPEPPAGLGGAGDVAGELGTAAKGLQDASVGFNLNTAQFGLAAGGLLLSSIGIATNSQELVYAGAVLQIAGLAIQLYEALTATTTVATMTVAAGALTGSAAALGTAATMLMMAAAVDAIPFLHSGGIITAHGGWPRLRSDEVPIIAQTGERVLSRRQNRDYEAGMGAGGSGSPVAVTVNLTNHFSTELTQAQCNKSAKNLVRAIKQEMRNKLSG